jgi:glycosyltransferase involved in cell wall biosynthesis
VLPAHAPGGLLSLCNTGPIRHGRQILCIHDTNTRNCPQSYSPAFRALYRLLLPAVARTAAAVTTVSAFSAGEIARHGVCRPGKISVIPNGHEHAARWVPEHSDRTRGAATPDTIVLIASPAPHKNLGLILGMADRLAAAGLRIAVAGEADPKVFNASVMTGPGAVAWLGRLTDGEIAALLRDSLCLAFPSLTEGFGMPPLEAMVLGCPTLVSDRASLPEICGDAALYAPPDDPEAWFRHFLALRHSPSLRRNLVTRGAARSRCFRWSEAAGRYLLTMAMLDKHRSEAAA